MNTKELIEKVIVSGILLKELTELSLLGATDNELAEAENRVGEKLMKASRNCSEHAMVQTWTLLGFMQPGELLALIKG